MLCLLVVSGHFNNKSIWFIIIREFEDVNYF